ncbi:MAG: NAD(P)H-dependent oxidoreductase [Thaumarchaeota archaeon]|nr:NAD(P)H-dependent oxidoreductase [Nitrososphaerota archaeon]
MSRDKKLKTLVVRYTPRNERSNTGKILDAFVKEAGSSEIEELDLAKEVPDLFLEESLGAYIQRNYLGQELSAEQKASLSKMDRMTLQVKSADIVVVAYPMNNFSMPAPVKAWFDSVMLKGQTWDAKDGRYYGLMDGRKALAIVTSGGLYSGEMSAWEHALSLARLEFQFMGYSEIQGVLGGGMNMGEEIKSGVLRRSIEDVRKIARKWYGEMAESQTA